MSDILFDHARKRGLDVQYASGGDELLMACPLCDDHKPRLFCNRRSGRWICHNCGEHGTVWSFLERICRLDPMAVYRAARQFIGTRPGVTEVTPVETPVVDLPEGSLPLDDPSALLQRRFWRYLEGRGIGPTLVREYELGYCPGGYYAGRVVVPIKMQGVLYGWIARDITGEAEKKVLTPPGAKLSQALFNIDHVAGPGVLLVEGVFDALAWPTQAVATLGAKLSTQQRRLLRGAGISRVTVLYDGDDAGRAAARRVGRELAMSGFDILIATLPDGTDPATVSSFELKQSLEIAAQV